jgi:CheY-like chemotaxis protein
VGVRSDGLGKGSEFTVTLPLLRRGVANDARRARGPEFTAPPTRVLVVDDNVDAAATLAMLLRLAGHDVRVAHDGPTALALAEADAPEVAFLDIGMPRMDGYELARRFRETTALSGVLLVALTGWGQEEDRRRTKEAGFDHHLVKPVEPDAVDRLLAGRGRAG